jgi:geranylgeranyl diphosphate synthase type I
MQDHQGTDLDSIYGQFENFIQKFFTERESSYQYGELFQPLYFDLCEFVGRKGKRIRPLLLMMSYRALGGQRSFGDESLLRCAIALELLHSFILIHDDVIDRSEKRRGLPTFHKLVEQRLNRLDGQERVGQNVAVVMGDMVFALAIRSLLETDLPPEIRDRLMGRFLGYATDTGCGEIYDILLGVRDITRVSREDILRMYHLKTTLYTFEAPCAMGAILAGVSEEKVKLLCEMAEPLGLAFQIQNDLLEFSHFESDDLLLSTDILEGKKTLLIREAFDRLNEVDKTFMQMCLNAPVRTESTILKVKDLIQKSKAVPFLEQRSLELFRETDEKLESSAFSEGERLELRRMFKSIQQQVRMLPSVARDLEKTPIFGS